MSRLSLTVSSRCWVQAPYRTGCATLHTVGRWRRWILIKITCVYGVVLLCTEEHVLIEAQQQPAVSQSFFKLENEPTDCPKTSLDELDKVERHLNQGTAFSDWLGIRVYQPKRLEDAEVLWHLIRNPPPQLKNILTIGIFEGYAFVIKNISKLARTYECTHCYARFTPFEAFNLQRHDNRLPGRKGRSPADSLRESFLSKPSSFQRIASVA